MKNYRGILFAIEIFIKRDARRVRATAPAVALVIMAALAGIFASGVAQALTADEAMLIDKGFLVFSKEKFNGNGRTCATCHLPQADFTIGPADIATLSAHQKELVFGAGIKPGNAGTGSLENSAMVQSLGLFNINDGV
jgi:hypothetical protein